jgi:hypothetical protein
LLAKNCPKLTGSAGNSQASQARKLATQPQQPQSHSRTYLKIRRRKGKKCCDVKFDASTRALFSSDEDLYKVGGFSLMELFLLFIINIIINNIIINIILLIEANLEELLSASSQLPYSEAGL